VAWARGGLIIIKIIVTSGQIYVTGFAFSYLPNVSANFPPNGRRQSRCAAKRELLEWKCNENIWKSGEMLAAHQDNQDFAAALCCLCAFFSAQIFAPICECAVMAGNLARLCRQRSFFIIDK